MMENFSDTQSIKPGTPAMPHQNRSTVLALVAILVLAAVLRLGWPDRSPPGLQVDEAYNAWSGILPSKNRPR